MFEERTSRDTSRLAMLLFRVGIVLVFVVMVARMFQLQVMRGRRVSDASRRESPGAYRDCGSTRGRLRSQRYNSGAQPPKFRSGLGSGVPTADDDDTEVDEEAQEIDKVLRILRRRYGQGRGVAHC